MVTLWIAELSLGFIFYKQLSICRKKKPLHNHGRGKPAIAFVWKCSNTAEFLTLWALPAVKWDNSTSEARTPQSNRNPRKVIKNFRQPEFVDSSTGNIDRRSSKFFKRPSLSQLPCTAVTSRLYLLPFRFLFPPHGHISTETPLWGAPASGWVKPLPHVQKRSERSPVRLYNVVPDTPLTVLLLISILPVIPISVKPIRSERKAAHLKALPCLPPRYSSHPLFSFNVYSTVCWIVMFDFWIVGNIRESPRNTAPIIHRNQSYILETISVRG